MIIALPREEWQQLVRNGGSSSAGSDLGLVVQFLELPSSTSTKSPSS